MRRWLATVAVAAHMTIGLVGAVPATAVAEAEAETKLDRAFRAELAADRDGLYYDVLVVFDDLASRQALLGGLDRPVHRYRHFPIARVALDRTEIAALVDDPRVQFVEANSPELELMNDEATALSRVAEVRPDGGTPDTGYTGAGVHVAIIDTGIDGTHPDLRDQIEHAWVMASPSPETYLVPGVPITGDPAQPLTDHESVNQLTDRSGVDGRVYVSTSPASIDVQQTFVEAVDGDGLSIPQGGYPMTDVNGHGTHVAGIVAANGTHDRGVAPGARVHSYQFASGGQTLAAAFLVEAFDHLLGDPRIRIVNASIGIETCNDANDEGFWRRPNQVAMRTAALEHDVLIVNSYGNAGLEGDNTCTNLSLQPYVLGVGNVEKGGRLFPKSSAGLPDGNHDRDRALRSLDAMLAGREHGEVALHRPAVVAPGTRIVSTLNPAHPHNIVTTQDELDPGYGLMTGTSMSAPHVAGLAALVIEAHERAHPGRPLSWLDLVRIIEGSADRDALLDARPHQAGAGLVDAVTAVELAARPEAVEGPSRMLARLTPLEVVADGVLDLAAGVLTVPEDAARLRVAVSSDPTDVELRLLRPGGGRPVSVSCEGVDPTRRVCFADVAAIAPVAGEWHVDARVAVGSPPAAVHWFIERAA